MPVLQDAAVGRWWFCVAPEAAIKPQVCCFSPSCEMRNRVPGLPGDGGLGGPLAAPLGWGWGCWQPAWVAATPLPVSSHRSLAGIWSPAAASAPVGGSRRCLSGSQSPDQGALPNVPALTFGWEARG